MSGQFQDKVALITGGSSGIGWAASQIFAREGAKVVVADINVPGGEEVVKKIKESGGEATFIKTDVRIVTEIEAMVSETLKKYGRLDYAFNNAAIKGSGEPVDIDKIEEEWWDNVVDTNMKVKKKIPAPSFKISFHDQFSLSYLNRKIPKLRIQGKPVIIRIMYNSIHHPTKLNTSTPNAPDTAPVIAFAQYLTQSSGFSRRFNYNHLFLHSS